MKRFFKPNKPVLLAANLIPLAGVFVWDWQAITLLACYFLETLIIGLFTIFRLFVLGSFNLKNKTGDTSGFPMIPFFILHYGMFVAIQSMFLTNIIADRSDHFENGVYNSEVLYFLSFAFKENSYIFLIGLMASHAVIFFNEFILNEKYKETDTFSEMFRPYSRIFLQQFLIIIGSFFLLIFNELSVLMVLFVILKIVVDEYFQPEIERMISEEKDKLENQ